MDSKTVRTHASLLSHLEFNSQNFSDKIAYRFLFDEKSDPETLTFREVVCLSKKLAIRLANKIEPGDRVMLMLENSLEYVVAFFACQYAGAVAITAYPYNSNDPRSSKLVAFANDGQPKVLLTVASFESETQEFLTLLDEFSDECSLELVSVADRSENVEEIDISFVKPDTLAMLQYTSGSTGQPKGVMLTYGNLLANARDACEALNLTEKSQMVSWLPIFHDLGLVGGVLTGVCRGFTCTILRPLTAIRNPLFWFGVISLYRGTATLSPNFGLDLVARTVQKFREESTHLDLSCLNTVLCGGEPIRRSTVQLFNTELGSLGLKETAFAAGYGLAESTNYMTASPHAKLIRHVAIDKSALKQNKVVAVLPSQEEESNDAVTVMSVGAFNHCTVVVVDPETHVVLGENEVGEVWTRGDSVGCGYWNKADQTAHAFHNKIQGEHADGHHYLTTGDLGFMNGGELFVTGRQKDLIVIRGENYYPQDIERISSTANPILNINNAVAFGVDIDGEEKACVVIEPYGFGLKKLEKQSIDMDTFFNEIVSQIQQYIFEQVGIYLHDIVIVKPKSIPKTTSGKLERAKTKSLYLAKSLQGIARLRLPEPKRVPENHATQEPSAQTNEPSAQTNEPSAQTNEPSAQIQTEALGLLLSALHTVLELPALELERSEPIASYGLDSIKVLQLFDVLSDAVQQELPPTLIYRYPTIDALSKVVAKALAQTPGNSHSAPVRNALKTKQATSEVPLHTSAEDACAIAIVGMAAKMPDADNIEQFWTNLSQGKNSIAEEPTGRGDWISNSGDKVMSWGGYLQDFDKFDADFFKISPHEALQMDAQQRLLLESTWHAIEDAGFSPASLSGSNTGVFFGVSNWDYAERLRVLGEPVYGHTAIGQAHTMLPNRVSYLLNLRGPSEPVDTACSSSLVAINHAMEALNSGKCDTAIVGAVNLIMSPTLHEAFEKAGMLSEDGQCKSFGDGANGYVRGEGVSVFVLKRLTQAEQERDNIHAVLLGSAVNHGGKASTLTSPNVQAQSDVIAKAHKAAKIDPATIAYVEAHGTGTALGDPVEIEGLKLAFSDAREQAESLSIGLGSVKSNIGHLEPAAGMAGMLKVIKSMHYKTLVPSLHSQKVNPLIDFADSGFYVVQACQDWPQLKKFDEVTQREVALPRRAGVSSFGFGGVNAHVVLEEYQPSAAQALLLTQAADAYEGPYVIVLSAKSNAQLAQRVEQLSTYIAAREDFDHADLARLMYTLQTGREAMHARLALVVESVADLRQKLTKLVEGRSSTRSSVKGLYQGQCKPVDASLDNDTFLQDGVKQWLMARQFHYLLSLWVDGLDVDWSILYGQQPPQKLSLPSYPFEKKRYWINPEVRHAGAQRILHPLLHQNTSTFQEQRFSSCLTGSERFLKDHQVQGQLMLPGVAYLEMAHQAALKAFDITLGEPLVELSHIVWSQPIVVAPKNPQMVHIELSPESDTHLSFEVYTDQASGMTLHGQGEARIFSESGTPLSIDLAELQAKLCDQIDASEVYQAFSKKGIVYGASHRGLQHVSRASHDGQVNEVLAQISLPAEVAGEYVMSPGLLDSALQASLCFFNDIHAAPLALPFALERIRVLRVCPKDAFVWLRRVSAPGDAVLKIDLAVVDSEGSVCLQLYGFSARALGPAVEKAVPTDQTLLFEPFWQNLQQESNPSTEMTESLVWFVGDAAELDALKIEVDSRVTKSVHWQHFQTDIGQNDQGYTEVCLALLQALKTRFETSVKDCVRLTVLVPDAPGFWLGINGLIKSISQEQPKLSTQVIAVNTLSVSAELANGLVQQLMSEAGEPIRFESMQPQRLGWRQLEPKPAHQESTWRENGVYLLTGGAGGLGLITAHDIAENTKQPTLVLCGRRERSELGQFELAALLDLERKGARVDYQTLDISDAPSVARVVSKAVQQYGSLHGVIHSAGLIQDAYLKDQTTDSCKQTFAPKVQGLLNLDDATAELSLDIFLAYSSLAAINGNAGQADYACANSFMDYWMLARQERVAKGECNGLSLSLNWPLWKVGGMQVDPAIEKSLYAQFGMSPLSADDGLNALHDGLRSRKPRVLVVHGDPAKLCHLLGAEQTQAGSEQTDESVVMQTMTSGSVDSDGLQYKLLQDLYQRVSELLKVDVNELDGHVELSEYGFDSISLTTFTNDYNQRYELNLAPTVFFETPTLDSFSAYLCEHYAEQLAPHFVSSTSTQLLATEQSNQSLATQTMAPGSADGDDLQYKLLQDLFRHVSEQLKVDVNELDGDVELSEYGFDSISLTTFTNDYNQRYGLNLAPTVFFETPTLDSFSAYLCEHYAEQLAPHFVSSGLAETQIADDVRRTKPVPTRRPRAAKRRFNLVTDVTEAAPPLQKNEAIAIVGISGAFPDSPTLDAFWENLSAGADCISEIPTSRWNWQSLYGDPLKEENKTNIKWGGFIEGMDEFDHTFFNISPKEAQLMDPQQRLLMQHAWQVIEDAGYSPKALSGTNTALYIGTSNTGYNDVLTKGGVAIEGYTSTGSVASVGPNRISYMLNLHGPSEPVETACSSALVALHRGVQAIRAGQCEQAIVGGVNTLVSPNAYISFNKAGMLCEDGRCKTFSKSANGYVRGEGVGLFFLKPLSQAEADGDHIYGLIKGSAQNHGGRANSLTAPNSKAQAMVIKHALEDADVDPRTVNYIETHGTGTALGDPVEINGLKNAFRQLCDQRDLSLANQYCALGAVKTNIGHLELAAGAAGLMKILLQLKHKTLVKNLHCDEVNQYIELEASPFFLLQENRPWVALQDAHGNDLPRRAGLSSFGFGGVNAHLVVQEYQPNAAQELLLRQAADARQGPYPVVLSAKNDAQLTKRVQQLSTYLESYEELDHAHLTSLVYTLQTGREAMDERLAIMAESGSELRRKLAALLQGQSSINGLYQGQRKKGDASLAYDVSAQDKLHQWLRTGEFHNLLGSWVNGLDVDWSRLYGEHLPQRISLPAYPFERVRHWAKCRVGVTSAAANPVLEPNPTQGHPLIGRTLNLPFSNETRFVASLHANQPKYMLDHKLFGTVVSPGASHVCSIIASAPSVVDSPMFAIEGITFEQTMILHEDSRLEVQIIYEASDDSDSYQWQLVSTPDEHDVSVVHASGNVSAIDQRQTWPSWLPLNDQGLFEMAPERFPNKTSADEFYGLMLENGYQLGESFKWISEIFKGDNEACSIMRFPEIPDRLADYPLYPGLLDSVFQMMTPCCEAFIDMEQGKYLYVPVMLGELHFYRPIEPNEMLRCYSQQISELTSKTELLSCIALFDATGTPVLTIEKFLVRRVRRELLLSELMNADSMEQWVYTVNWQKTDNQSYWSAPHYLPSATSIAKTVQPAWHELVQNEALAGYPDVLQFLEARSVDYMLLSLKRLGWSYRKGTVITPEQVVDDLSIKPSYLRLVNRMLTVIGQTQYLSIQNGQFVVEKAIPKKVGAESLKPITDEMVASFPESILLERCAQHLVDVLSDEQDPLELLFPEGDDSIAAAIYTDSQSAFALNQCIKNIVLECVANLPEKRHLRILEIGAGTGGTTTHLLPVLGDVSVEYVFTDLSQLFLSQAKSKFSEYSFVQYETLNIEQSPLEQGFLAQHFDLVIASNVVHATSNLTITLNHIRQLLAPNGALVLMEITQKLNWLDLTFGLTDGWWCFQDTDLRETHALINPQQWHELLTSCGFSSVATATDNANLENVLSEQSVIIAQNNLNQTTKKHWVILSDGQDSTAAVVQAIMQSGALCSVVALPGFQHTDDIPDCQSYALNEFSADQFIALLSQIETEQGYAVHDVLMLQSLAPPDVATADSDALMRYLEQLINSSLCVMQALVSQMSVCTRSLRFLTIKSAMIEDEKIVGLGASPLWGMCKALRLEQPELTCQIIDVDGLSEETSLEDLVRVLHMDIDEPEVAIRNNARYYSRLSHFEDYAALKEPIHVYDNGSYLITGGLNGLGLLTAQYLVDHGAKHLILTGRNGPTTEVQQQITSWQTAGVGMTIHLGDVSDFNDLHAFFSETLPLLPSLKGVFHSAGTLDDGSLMNQNWGKFACVMSAKVQGSWNLHRLTEHIDLEYFVMFSSAAALIGSPGQSNHSAANSFMDALAAHRQGLGLAALSINWGPWLEIGAASAHKADEYLSAQGVNSILPEEGLELFEKLVGSSAAYHQAGVMKIDWEKFDKQLDRLQLPAYFSEMNALVAVDADLLDVQASLIDDLNNASGEHRFTILLSLILEQVASNLGITGEEKQNLSVDVSIKDLGLDSLASIGLISDLKDLLGVKLPSKSLMENPSIERLTDICLTLMTDSGVIELADENEADGSAAKRAKQTRWIIRQANSAKTEPDMRLFCLHYLGGGASVFNQWSNVLPDNIEVCAIQLPGREERSGEDPSRSMDTVIEHLINEIEPLLDKPFAVYGHSMGSLIGFELIRAVRRNFKVTPVHFWASAYYAPDAVSPFQKITDLNDETILRMLPKLLKVPKSLIKSQDFIDSMLPMIKADLSIVSSYKYREEEKLECPITVLGGKKDLDVLSRDLEKWRSLTAEKFSKEELPGGHIFVLENREQVLEKIRLKLLEIISP